MSNAISHKNLLWIAALLGAVDVSEQMVLTGENGGSDR